MRHLIPFVALILVASAAPAQHGRKGPPIDLVAAPPVVPTPVFFPVWNVPYWGGVYGNPFYPDMFPQSPVVILPQPLPAPAPVVNPARALEDADRAAAFAPAALTLELPAVADVWLDGEKQPGSTSATRTLRSTPLKLGAEYTFRIRARWVEGGTNYEAAATSTVRAGERGKLTVYAGTPVK